MGLLGGVGAILGASRGCQSVGVRVYWGLTGHEVLRGQKGHQGTLGLLRGVEGLFWGVRGCRDVRGVLGLAGSLGTQGPEEV